MMVIPLAAAFAATVAPTVSASPIASQSITTRWLLFLPWYLALASASAFLLHRYVEKPVLIWRDRYLNRPPSRTQSNLHHTGQPYAA
jgi:hypothetical protein